MLHEQVLLHGRGGYLHVQRLVLDEKVSCVSADTFAHNGCPRLYEAVLIVGRFDTIQAHELLNDFAYLFGVSFPHGVWVLMVNDCALTTGLYLTIYIAAFNVEYLIVAL